MVVVRMSRDNIEEYKLILKITNNKDSLWFIQQVINSSCQFIKILKSVGKLGMSFYLAHNVTSIL